MPRFNDATLRRLLVMCERGEPLGSVQYLQLATALRELLDARALIEPWLDRDDLPRDVRELLYEWWHGVE